MSDTEKEQSEQIQQMLNSEEDKTALKVLLTDTYESPVRANVEETCTSLKLMKGKNDPTTFLPLKPKIGGQVRHAKDKENMCLIPEQANCIYKNVEQECIVTIGTIKQEIGDDKLEKDSSDNKEEVNPCRNIVINEFDRDNIIASQMEQRLILSNVVNYVQYDWNPREFYNLGVKVIDQKIIRKYMTNLKRKMDRL